MVTNCDRKSFGLCREKFQKLIRWLSSLIFWSTFRHFGTHFTESFHMSKSSWMMYPTHSCEMPSCSAIDLAKLRQSSKISSWIWSVISGVVTVLGHPGWGTSQVEKSCFNWATQYLTVAYNGVCSPNVSVRMAWISFSAFPCRKKNLMTAHVSMLLKSHALPDMLPFSLCNKKRREIQHMSRPPFSKNLILRHREVGQAKDLSAPSRTLPHSLTKYVHIFTYLAFLQRWWQQLRLYSIKG